MDIATQNPLIAQVKMGAFPFSGIKDAGRGRTVVELQDVAVIDYRLFSELQGPFVKAMAQFVFDGIDRPQIAWIDLTPQEAETIVAISRNIERRFLSRETPVPEEAKHPWGFLRPLSDE
ncbi:MAG TPA: hypothetical protein VMY40_08280 [Anaerolineae bacterium]|nr:hypothetical protein [Anaerolineae bacterium]